MLTQTYTNGKVHQNGHALTIPEQYSLEAERATLGSILIDPPALHLISAFLEPDAFHLEIHRWAYAEMQQLAAQNRPVDLLILEERLSLRSTGPADGWASWLVGLLNEVPTSVNVEEYAKLVHEHAIRRKMKRAAGEIANMSFTDGDLEVQLGRAETLIFDIRQGRSVDSVLLPRQYVTAGLSAIEERRESGGKMTGLPTGFADLDRLLRGLKAPQVYVLAARPGMGKTAMALRTAAYLALTHDKRVALFTPEMTEEQVFNRIVSSYTDIHLNDIEEGRLNDRQMGQVYEVAGRLADKRLFIDPTPEVTPGAVRSRAMRLHAEHGLDLIIVDHLHEMKADTNRNGRHLELGDMIRTLKAVGKTVNVPMLVLAQLSRSVESRQDKRPQLSDLRESGAIEEVAYAVLFMYRDDYYNPDTTTRPNICEVSVAKHRDGATGTVDLFWHGPTTKLRDLERQVVNL